MPTITNESSREWWERTKPMREREKALRLLLATFLRHAEDRTIPQRETIDAARTTLARVPVVLLLDGPPIDPFDGARKD